MKYATTIKPGQGRGRKIGFPTYNLVIPEHFSSDSGVYATWAWIHGRPYKAAGHFGPVPTYADPHSSLELHILDYTETAPVDHIEFEFAHYLRPVQTFTSLKELQDQIAQDIEQTQKALS